MDLDIALFPGAQILPKAVQVMEQQKMSLEEPQRIIQPPCGKGRQPFFPKLFEKLELRCSLGVCQQFPVQESCKIGSIHAFNGSRARGEIRGGSRTWFALKPRA